MELKEVGGRGRGGGHGEEELGAVLGGAERGSGRGEDSEGGEEVDGGEEDKEEGRGDAEELGDRMRGVGVIRWAEPVGAGREAQEMREWVGWRWSPRGEGGGRRMVVVNSHKLLHFLRRSLLSAFAGSAAFVMWVWLRLDANPGAAVGFGSLVMVGL